jgi:WD40 repeat protein
MLMAPPSQELWSFSLGGGSGNVVAAGANSQILCWDWRTKQQLACLEDCHTEAVTQVAFHPTKKEKLVSASVDGLMCIFDTKGDINDDEGMEFVSNHHIIR